MTYDEYLDQMIGYARPRMNADPEWQAFQNAQWSGGGGADAADNALQYNSRLTAPSRDYYTDWFNTLPPAQQAEFARLMQEDKSGRWQTKVGNVLKVAVPALVGGAALAATGALGAGLQSFVGGAPLGSAGAAAGAAAAPAAVAPEMASTLPFWDTGVGPLFGSQTAIDTALASTAPTIAGTSIPTLASGAYYAGSLGALPGLSSASSLLDAALGPKIPGTNIPSMSNWTAPGVTTPGTSGTTPSAPSTPGTTPSTPGTTGTGGLWDLFNNNRGLISLLGGLLAGAGANNSSGGSGGSSGSSGQVYPKQPGLSFGTLQQRPMNQSPGLLSSAPVSNLSNSGLSRFGATGGVFTPTPYVPQIYRWGK